MQCCVFGVANHSPDDVVSALLKNRIVPRSADIGILPPAAKADTRFSHLLLLSVADLTRNLSKLAKADIRAFVFSNPIDLVTIKGIRGLDYAQVDDFSFNYTDLNLATITKSTPVPIKRVPSDFLPRLIDNVKHGSLLNPLMTFIYSQSSQNQNVVKLAAVRFLYHGQTGVKLAEELKGSLSDRAVDKLLAILSSSAATSYASALQTIKLLRKKRQPVDVEALAKATGTSAYELSYMLTVIDDKQKYTDSFDKAKNRRPAK